MNLKEYRRFAEGSYGHQLAEFKRIAAGINQTRCVLCSEHGVIKNGRPTGLLQWCRKREKPRI